MLFFKFWTKKEEFHADFLGQQSPLKFSLLVPILENWTKSCYMSYKLPPLVPQEAKGWLLSRPNYKTKILPFSELCAEYCPFGITMVDCPCADFFMPLMQVLVSSVLIGIMSKWSQWNYHTKTTVEPPLTHWVVLHYLSIFFVHLLQVLVF